MSKDLAEYSVQPPYNESFKPTGPPSYSEATASSFCVGPNVNQLLYPNQPELNSNPQAPQIPSPNFQPAVITVSVSVGPEKAHLQCPHCHTQVCTITKSSLQKSAYYACFLLCLFGCCLCSCIPYCLPTFKNVHHFCPECKGFIGTYRN